VVDFRWLWVAFRPLASFAFATLVACGGGETARVEIELAAAPDPTSQDDRACIGRVETASLVDCYRVTVQRYEGGRLVDVPVARPDDDHDMPQSGTLFFPARDQSSLRWDARLVPDAAHRIEIVAYLRTGEPYARGSADFRPGTSRVRVRLEPVGRWACAGERADGTPPAARALHVAVALPNGDVLLLGGVTGNAVPAASTEVGAPLQRSVEVYDASESRFYEVDAVDRSAGDTPGFGAVFHRAFYLDTLEDGRYRVRVIGGFRATGDAAAARFDSTQGLTHYSSPVLPGARADVRDSVDVLYDPNARRAEIVSIEPGRVPRAGFNAVAPPDRSDLMFRDFTMVALGLTYGGGAMIRPMPTLTPTWYALPLTRTSDAMSMPLTVGRFGATASRLGDGVVLVWGGNVDMETSDAVNAHAGELIGARSGLVAGGVSGLPNSTALHTATPIAGGVLIAGGVEILPISALSGGMSTMASRQPLTVISAGLVGTPVPVDSSVWPSAILHAATAMPDQTVVITGGAIRMRDSERGSGTLWAVNHAIRVVRSALGGYEVQRLPPMIGARWGHAIAPLPGNRVLVTGGFVRSSELPPMDTLRAISAAEVLSIEPDPEPITMCGSGRPMPTDGG
jgi:hypothetical protein